jgi:3-hydroxybutyryl-CoA dehydrogenase
MMNENLVSVIGSGTMGNGIAHVFALDGYEVNLVDVDQTILEKALSTIKKNLERQVRKELITQTDMEKALSNLKVYPDLIQVSDSFLVIEAVTEDGKLKKDIFKKIDDFCNDGCILASNTSSISITEIAAVTNRADKVIGMHFMNPVPIMKLVEIIRGLATSDETCEKVKSLVKNLKKIPVEVNDYPGFISNRILMPMINEAGYCLMEGVAVGLDVCLSIMEILHNGLGDSKYRPCPLLKKMVAAGNLGKKSGKGFYEY